MSLLISGKDVPFFAIKCPQMASLMVEDLFNRVLPTNPLVDKPKLLWTSGLLPTFDYTGAIGHEISVWLRTYRVLDICISSLRAVGLSFRYRTEFMNNAANVRMDTVVVQGTDIRLAMEDKSPKVFLKNCTEEEIGALCGSEYLHMNGGERGFRSIFFKVCRYLLASLSLLVQRLLQITVFMAQEHIRWGVIHCGTHMRIIRLEYKDGRPYAIISEEIVVDNPPPSSIFSLICYMLLTGDGEVPIFEGTRGDVPAPPQIAASSSAGAGPQTRSQKALQTTLMIPGPVTSVGTPIPYVSMHWLKQLVDDVAHHCCCGQITR